MPDLPQKSSRPNKYLRLFAISSQFTATVLGFALLGYMLDGYFKIEKNYITLALTMVGVMAGLYLLYAQVKKMGDS